MEAGQSIAALAALAHETRLAVFRLLVQHGPDGLPAGAIAQALALPPSSLTFHLQHLMRAGLLTQRRVSRQLIYAADFAVMNALLAYLTENCCGRGAAAAEPGQLPEQPEEQRRDFLLLRSGGVLDHLEHSAHRQPVGGLDQRGQAFGPLDVEVEEDA